MSALTDSVAPERRQAAIAVNRLAINIGSSIGPAVGGFLAVASFPLLFVVDGITTLIAALALSVLLWRDGRTVSAVSRAVESSVHATSVQSRSIVWRDKRALALVAAAFLVNFVYTQDIGALPLFVVRDLHFPESFFGSLFLLNTIIIIAIEVPLNLAMGRWAPWRACALAAVLIALGYGTLLFARDALPIMLTVVLWTFGEMIFYPTVTASMADIAGAGRTGEYMGALSAAYSLALMLGPWAGTALLDHAGATQTWVIMFAVAIAGALLIAATRPRVHELRAEARARKFTA
jgi:MFS family permease